MTQQNYLGLLQSKLYPPIKGFESLTDNVLEIAKQAYDAGFDEGIRVAVEIQDKVSSLLRQ